jgi:hypothetical protein
VASVAESFAVDLTSDTLWFPLLVVDVVMTAIVTTVVPVPVAATKCVNTSGTKCDLATLNKSETKKLHAWPKFRIEIRTEKTLFSKVSPYVVLKTCKIAVWT